MMTLLLVLPLIVAALCRLVPVVLEAVFGRGIE